MFSILHAHVFLGFNNSSNRKRAVTVGTTPLNPGCKNTTGGTSGPSSSFQIALHPVPFIPTAQNPSDSSNVAVSEQRGSSLHATNKLMPFHQKPTKVIVGNVSSQYGNVEYVQSSANNSSSEKYYVNAGTVAASANESLTSPRLSPTSAVGATTFSFSDLQEVAGRQLVLSKLNPTSSNLVSIFSMFPDFSMSVNYIVSRSISYNCHFILQRNLYFFNSTNCSNSKHRF